jgi:hypothetical protein
MKQLSIIICFLLVAPNVLAQSWYGGESYINFDKADISTLLLNNLEIMSVRHDEPTKIHPKANLTIRSNTDSTLKDPNLDDPVNYFRNAIYNDYGKHRQINKDKNLFIENYAGYDKESNFSFSTRVEREVRDKRVKRIVEVVTEGKMIEDRQYFETQFMGFNNKKLETYTYCSGYLYRAPVEGKMRRLYRKKDKQYSQAKFNCKTLTRPICNRVYRGEQKTMSGRHKGTAFFDGLENEILDVANYQQIQKNNMGALKGADRPGGKFYRQWPTDPYLHHYSGLGENGVLTQRETTWIVDECKEKLAFFHEPYKLFDDDPKPNNPSRPSRSISSGGGGAASSY